MNLKLLSFSLLVWFIVALSFSQTLPADNVFFNPTYGSGTQNILPSAGTGDDTQTFNNAIDALTVSGGTITVQPGIYRILEVQLKSNVHLDINPGVTFVPFNPLTGTNNAMFSADSNTGIENFSIIGTGGNFNIDLSGLLNTLRIRVISFKYCSNFKVSNFDITDSYTEFSSLAFGSNYTITGTGVDKRINAIRGVPNMGIIENISMNNAHYGYGLVQVQGGNNLLFRNLSCEGGVALRLETGFDLIQYTSGAIFDAIKLNNIWGRNLECTNGQSALQISPHTLNQGVFDVSGVTATSCEAGVVWSSGFTTDEQATNGLISGSFDSTSKVRDVTVTFGQNAQLHPSKRLRYLPCQLRVERSGGIGISVDLNVDGESRLGPSIGSVLREEDKVGHYSLDFPVSEVTAVGYNIETYYMPPSAIFRNSYDDYEICNESIDGVNFFVPAEFRDTPNPRNPLESSLGSDEFKVNEFLMYPNPTTGELNINMSQIVKNQKLTIYNVLGKIVYKSILDMSNKNNEFNLSSLKRGVYFVSIENQTVKKLIIK
jgi:hypothetical protein